MARIKILKSETDPVRLHVIGVGQAVIPFNDRFHDCPDNLLPTLDLSGVEYELEQIDDGSEAHEPEQPEETPPPPANNIENAGSQGAAETAGDADGLGGSTASPPIQPIAADETVTGETVEEVQPDSAEGAALQQLDHDGDGQPGGSLKGAESTAAKGAARKKKGK